MKILYRKYLNVLLFLSSSDYRGYKLETEKLDEKSFANKISKDEYVDIKALDKNKKNIICFLFPNNSKYLEQEYMIKLLNKLDKENKNGADIIFISKEELHKNIRKNYIYYENLTIYNYLHKIFLIPINHGPLCPKYKLLSKNESEDLLNNLMKINKDDLRKIKVDDPQMIWIDAKVGNIVECIDVSFYSIFSCKYELVIYDIITSLDVNKEINIDNYEE